MDVLLLSAYFGVLTLLALSGLHRFHLTFHALRPRRKRATPAEGQPSVSGAPSTEWPQVLVQLPMYNEAFVAERVIRSVAALEYPRDQLVVQVLDDSTDDTVSVVNRVVADLQRQAVPIEIVRRPDRTGFKAGALAYGLKSSDADLVAIFDADFVPPTDFLKRLVPHLVEDPGLGLVQARWGHLNRDASLLTRAQGVFLDGHFAIEHGGRDRAQLLFNFNGTAGVWRRQAIDDAGGWRADTITEDLDLSYRAQLAGWRFRYEHDVVAPAELPQSWTAFRSQQARWVRGSVETARLMLGRVLSAPGLTVTQRAEAVVHLTNNFAYLFMAALAFLLPAAVVLRDQLGWRVPGGQLLLSGLDITMLVAGTLAMVVFYGAAAIRCRAGWRVGDLLYALCLGCGMSTGNALEVVRGMRSRRSEFVRTPKQGVGSSAAPRGPGRPAGEQPRAAMYRSALKIDQVAVELLMTFYHACAVGYALYFQLWGALPFFVMYLVGFGSVGVATLVESMGTQRAKMSVFGVGIARQS